MKKHLPRCFLREYLGRGGLHDYDILGISVIRKRRAYSCEVRLTDGEETLKLIMTDLHAIRVDMEALWDPWQPVRWGYEEFSVTPDKHIHLCVICDIVDEMMFEFKTIDLVREKSGSRRFFKF